MTTTVTVPTVGVYIEPTKAGWVATVGGVVLASGGWSSAEAATVQALAVAAQTAKAEQAGVARPTRSGHPGVAWPLPLVSVAGLLDALTGVMGEQILAALAWWHGQGVEVPAGESPWLVAVSDVHVPASRRRSAGELRALQGLGSAAYLLGAVVGRWPGCVVIACPDAGDRHLPAKGGTGRLGDYWPPSLRGVKARVRAPHGRHAYTVAADGCAAYVSVHGLALPVMTTPMTVSARPAGIGRNRGPEATPVAEKPFGRSTGSADADAGIGRNRGSEASPVAEKPFGRSRDTVETRAYLTALRTAVTGAVPGTTPTLADVHAACTTAITAIPLPAGVTPVTAADLTVALILRAGITPHLAADADSLRARVEALA